MAYAESSDCIRCSPASTTPEISIEMVGAGPRYCKRLGNALLSSDLHRLPVTGELWVRPQCLNLGKVAQLSGADGQRQMRPIHGVYDV
jgi:hypothetical protein